MKLQFTGTEKYIATPALQTSVNAAIFLQKPLLVKGEPGTGKTMLAEEIAAALNKPLITWHIKSTTSAKQGLYEYDAVSRLRDSQLASDKVHDLRNYIRKGKLWEAFEAKESVVLLIDEVDKADIEFPNDLLLELDRMEFYCYELLETIRAISRPIVIITSNNEKDLPDAFLRRCIFHFIEFPDAETLLNIVDVHFPGIHQDLAQAAIAKFNEIRNAQGIRKKPSTSELIDWIRLLLADRLSVSQIQQAKTQRDDFPYLGVLLKNEQDLMRVKIPHR